MRKSILLVMGIAIFSNCRDHETGKEAVLPSPKKATIEVPSGQRVSVETRSVAVDKGRQFQLIENKNEMELITSYLKIPEKRFLIEPGRSASVTTPGGAQLKINPVDLVTADGKMVTGPINVLVKEYTGKLDMLKVNAQTASNGQLLVSGGSYYLELSSNNIPLQLREGRAIDAYFPGMNQPGMELFYGAKDDKGNMNWIKTAERAEKSSWQFNNWLIKIFPGSIRFFSQIEKDGKARDWEYEIDDYLRKKIDSEISQARIFNLFKSFECSFTVNAYTFQTKDCVIYVSSDVLSNDSDRTLTSQQAQFLKKEIDCYDPNLRERVAQQDFTNKIYSSTQINKLGWINCDKFYSDTSFKKEFIVRLNYPGTVQANSILVFMVFKNMNSLLNGYSKSATEFTFSNIPSGQDVSIVAITRVKGKIIVGKTSCFKLSALNGCEINLQEISQKLLDPFINSL